MEILRWTGQPSMALINPIGGDAHVEEWRAALSQYFKIVRVFDAHAAHVRGAPRPAARLRPSSRRSGARRSRPRSPRSRRSASACTRASRARLAELLADDALVRRDAPDARRRGSRPTSASRSSASGRRRCARASAQARRAVEQIYGHRAIEREERPVELREPDLFSIDHWFLWGLNRRQLVASGAAGGAAVGGVIDAAAHGASLLAGALIGAAVGGAGAWWSSERLAQIRVFALPLGGQLLALRTRREPELPLRGARPRAPPPRADRGPHPRGAQPARARGRGGRELDRAPRRGRAPRRSTGACARCGAATPTRPKHSRAVLAPIVAQGDAPGARLTGR